MEGKASEARGPRVPQRPRPREGPRGPQRQKALHTQSMEARCKPWRTPILGGPLEAPEPLDLETPTKPQTPHKQSRRGPRTPQRPPSPKVEAPQTPSKQRPRGKDPKGQKLHRPPETPRGPEPPEAPRPQEAKSQTNKLLVRAGCDEFRDKP